MSLNHKKISEFFGVVVEKKFLGVGVGIGAEKKLFSGSELESESKKNFFRSQSRVSESKSVTPLITIRRISNEYTRSKQYLYEPIWISCLRYAHSCCNQRDTQPIQSSGPEDFTRRS
jgi:hypothetical protein